MSMILTCSLSTVKNAMAIMLSAKRLSVIFCFKVMLLSFTNPSKCFLYRSVPLNHTSNFSDPFTKQKDASSNSGVVGITGNIIPTIPKPKLINPAKINNNFVNLLI